MSLLKADGFDKAIIGVDMTNEKVVYDKVLMIEILLKRGLTLEDAIDYLEHNVYYAYVGEHTPIYMDKMSSSEIDNLEI